jgi:hypothetical protein
MNITNEQLKQIIKEEMNFVLVENEVANMNYLELKTEIENLSKEIEVAQKDGNQALVSQLSSKKKELEAELQNKPGAGLAEGIKEHIKTRTPLHENIFRVGSECYFNTIRQGRYLHKRGLYEAVNEEERDMLENTDLGEFAMFEGQEVPLDFPMWIETLEEAEKKKKDPPLNKPMKNTGGGKKWKVYVRSKSGGIKKVTYGDAKGGLKGNWNNAEAKKSFAARHDCKNKKDKTTPGYWSCRANRDHGGQTSGYW